jgi:hypothetical protein
MPDATSNLHIRPRRWTIFAAALLVAALALVVIYTDRGAFLSPLALVVVTAIGLAALLIQLRLQSGLTPVVRAPLWLNVLGIIFALAAMFADVLRLSASLALMAALGAVMSFAISGIIVISALRRKPRAVGQGTNSN